MLLWNVEPEYDTANPAATVKALAQADTVIAFSSYRNGAMEYADAILPIAPFTETAGTFVNCEGRTQSFNGAVRPAGEVRPGWKVLRVLANLLDLPGFDYETPEAVRTEALSRRRAFEAVEPDGDDAVRVAGAWHAAQARREMSQHLQEVEEDLLTIQKQKKIRGLVLSLDRGFRLQKEVMPDKGRTSKSKKKARVIDLDN